MSGPAVLAVDGGNSKTEVALVDAAGAVVGAARGPGASHHHLGVPGAMVLGKMAVKAIQHSIARRAEERQRPL